jgi:hypothetical protein
MIWPRYPCPPATSRATRPRAISRGAEGSMTVTGGASGAQVRAVRDRICRIPKLIVGFDSRHPLHGETPGQAACLSC